MSGFVYRWYDSSNGMYYVGSHKGSVDDSYKGSGKRFKKAYNKRPECFTREVFYIGEHYRELEEFILDTVDAKSNPNYYNLINGSFNCKFSREQRDKISNSLTGKKHSNESKRKMSLSRTGEKNHFYGKRHSKDSLIKMSESKKGKYIGDDAMQNAWNASKKRVYCEHLDMEFDSIRECAEAVGLSAPVVSNMIAGRQRNRYGIIKI
jgi:group I intron endonuclease